MCVCADCGSDFIKTAWLKARLHLITDEITADLKSASKKLHHSERLSTSVSFKKRGDLISYKSLK